MLIIGPQISHESWPNDVSKQTTYFPHSIQAFVLACIYPNSEETLGQPSSLSSEVQNGLDPSNKPLYPKDFNEQANSPANLCTASTWSVSFSPNKLIISSDSETNLQSSSDEGKIGVIGTLARPKTQVVANTDMFTVSIIAVIIGLGLVAVICITVGCVMRRRRPKTLKDDMTIDLGNTDISLKTPLMNPNSSKFGESNGKIEAVQNISPTTGSNTHTVPKVRSAISINHLPEYVEKLKLHNGLEMSEEYESIESGMNLTWKHANIEENRPKNRYANVVAYDHSRVILTATDQVVGSDYINANYIDGYQRPRAYIATQGPLPETFYDFWRMVWEQNSYVIVMMTKLEERARVKCDQYWPSRGTETFSDMNVTQLKGCTLPTYTVTINETAEFAYYTLRTFTLKRLNVDGHSVTDCTTQGGQPEHGNDIREIKHFQFTAWPDYGTPDHPQPLILFIRRVTQMRAHILHQLQQERLANGESLSTRGLYSGSEPGKPNGSTLAGEIGPTIVHCSAGVGRTGAFIVIDSQLERLRHEKSVDIFGSVGRMRTQRNFMVQTEQQYTFLYDVFVEATTVHGTEVTAHGLYNHVVKLRQTATTNLPLQNTSVGNGIGGGVGKPLNLMGPSGLELEFKKLNLNLAMKKQFTTAILPENRLKNRSAEILPFEFNRVCLPLIRGLAGSDYINASFIDGYRRKHAYIATQTPLPNTIDDFWRLIWEQNSPIIVLLNEVPSTTESVPLRQGIYWPMERSTRYQHLLVEPIVEYNMPHFILREFRLTDTRDGQSRTLRQFQLRGWPQDSVVPKSAEAMIDLIGQVHKTQTQFGQDGPITVHCRYHADSTDFRSSYCTQ
ncbi:receptor-type tyrosine-protein phosphatase delta [Paragonimus westermani]|uniref:Receptor-type tyrosine-protein phosphatase delta n=1 Tax=Paragonimus westermani TaxID=34504 RepID=A0A5J4P0V4_9TREM|nr:receptor-type tyrosine-protein phosphatase delta [Paragonimus westermani]